uniref:Uncharacterized protein n=1 Tax=Felis catus TaxID=9685 RepID=A0ABI7VPV3_FELCA
MTETIKNQEKLTKLQAQVCIGGKGTARERRRWFIEQLQQMIKKLQFSLKKLGVNNISGFEELWMERHHLLPERVMMMKFQILWRILMTLPRMEQTEMSQLLKKIKLEEVTGSCYFIL